MVLEPSPGLLIDGMMWLARSVLWHWTEDEVGHRFKVLLIGQGWRLMKRDRRDVHERLDECCRGWCYSSCLDVQVPYTDGLLMWVLQTTNRRGFHVESGLYDSLMCAWFCCYSRRLIIVAVDHCSSVDCITMWRSSVCYVAVYGRWVNWMISTPSILNVMLCWWFWRLWLSVKMCGFTWRIIRHSLHDIYS